MDYKTIMQQALKDHPKRIEHTLNVLDRALELGKLYDADLEVLEVAALLHDITKYYTKAEHLKLIKEDVSDYKTPLLHPISAYYFAQSLNIKDAGILEAIKYHMWGKIDMRLETMILVVSDYCEPQRTFKQAKQVYELAKTNLLESYLLSIKSTIDHLVNHNKTPHKEQLIVYNYYKGEVDAR